MLNDFFINENENRTRVDNELISLSLSNNRETDNVNTTQQLLDFEREEARQKLLAETEEIDKKSTTTTNNSSGSSFSSKSTENQNRLKNEFRNRKYKQKSANNSGKKSITKHLSLHDLIEEQNNVNSTSGEYAKINDDKKNDLRRRNQLYTIESDVVKYGKNKSGSDMYSIIPPIKSEMELQNYWWKANYQHAHYKDYVFRESKELYPYGALWRIETVELGIAVACIIISTLVWNDIIDISSKIYLIAGSVTFLFVLLVHLAILVYYWNANNALTHRHILKICKYFASLVVVNLLSWFNLGWWTKDFVDGWEVDSDAVAGNAEALSRLTWAHVFLTAMFIWASQFYFDSLFAHFHPEIVVNAFDNVTLVGNLKPVNKMDSHTENRSLAGKKYSGRRHTRRRNNNNPENRSISRVEIESDDDMSSTQSSDGQEDYNIASSSTL